MEKLRKQLSSERGLTLIEVLLALVIVSMVLLLINSVHLFGQKQFIHQSEQINHQSDLRLAIKMITKDIRDENIAEVPDEHTLVINSIEYKLVDTDLMKNGTSIVEDIKSFTPKKIEEGIEVSITSVPDRHGNSESIETEIYFRK